LEEAQPLVTQFEAREDEDRETFVTAEGLVQEVEEEDAEVGRLLLLLLLLLHTHGSHGGCACGCKRGQTVMPCVPQRAQATCAPCDRVPRLQSVGLQRLDFAKAVAASFLCCVVQQ
jgi:hypothetical protein